MVTEAVYDGALLVVVDAHDTVHELGLCVGVGEGGWRVRREVTVGGDGRR